MKPRRFLAFDLGAGSVRAVLGTVEAGILSTREIARFPNEIKKTREGLFWDLDSIFVSIVECLAGCRRSGIVPDSIGVDAWGVDYALLGSEGSFLSPPHSYRDPRTGASFRKLASGPGARAIYDLSGVQLLPINTLFQLHAEKTADPGVFDRAESLLFIPDAVNYLLTGNAGTERTIASTSQLVNARTGEWEPALLEIAGAPRSLMPRISKSMEIVGKLSPEVRRRTGLPAIPVIAVGSHDTASAVAAVPAEGGNWAFLSSGTWSLLGMELKDAETGNGAFEGNFTNEAGVFGTVRFLKNVCGMWLVSECLKSWGAASSGDFEALAAEAQAAPRFRTLVDPDWQRFVSPSDMPEAIREFARMTGQPEPQSRGEFSRSVLESLALKYRMVLEGIARITGSKADVLHAVGGGARNSILNRFTADAAGIPVIAGPFEASVAGNILAQAAAQGMFDSLAGIRECMRRSTSIERFEPGDPVAWDRAYERFKGLVSKPGRAGTQR